MKKTKQQTIMDILNKPLSEANKAKLIWNAACDMCAERAGIKTVKYGYNEPIDVVDTQSILNNKFEV